MKGERSFVDELKRRRVPRVVLVYVASAFAVLQGAQLIVVQLQLPGWIVTARAARGFRRASTTQRQ